MSTDVEKVSSQLNAELHENNPNADKVVKALRQLGYSNATGLCDITDNSIDGGATEVRLEIKQSEGSFLFRIIDNGVGMDDATLSQALRLGSHTDRITGDLGLYGMGLVTAGIGIARKILVTTKTAKGPVLFSMLDVDQQIKMNTFAVERGIADEYQSQLFEDLTNGAKSGTIITLTECDRPQYNDVRKFQSAMLKEYGQIYRNFIVGENCRKIDISVNEEQVVAIDPLFRDDPETEIFYDDNITFINKMSGKSHVLHATISLVADHGPEWNKTHGLNLKNQGFYIVRNYREIAAAETLNLFTRHNSMNRFRAELLVNGELDEDLGVNFTKRNVTLNELLQNRLEVALADLIKDAKNKISGAGKSRRAASSSDSGQYSITYEVKDKSALYCLKGLAYMCEKTGNRARFFDPSPVSQSESDVIEDFSFSNEDSLATFIYEAGRLLGSKYIREAE